MAKPVSSYSRTAARFVFDRILLSNAVTLQESEDDALKPVSLAYLTDVP